MRILIVSHNCISRTSNMGKTLLSYFHGTAPEDIAQFYIQCEEPADDTLCRNYFRFTDMDALKALLGCNPEGRIFSGQEIHRDRILARVDAGRLEGAYQYGQRRTALGYAVRELVWSRQPWRTGKLWQWLESFSPDVIFFASGDYGFSYEIAVGIADHAGKPLAVCCVDEYYRFNRNENSFLGRLVHRRFLGTVRKTMDRAGVIFTICESLQQEYRTMFSKPCRVLRTAAVSRELPEEKRAGIAYLGNLELQRDTQLIQIGKTLQRLNLPGVPKYLDVYSCERKAELLRGMVPENGIRFHGPVSGDAVLEILGRSLAVVHTESFAPRMQKIVRCSVSTKIPESLMNGPCLIAFGPEGVASMDYLIQNGAAYCITDPEDLARGLAEILTNESLRSRIQARARILARENHSTEAVSGQLHSWLLELCGEQNVYENHADQLRIPPGQYREACP